MSPLASHCEPVLEATDLPEAEQQKVSGHAPRFLIDMGQHNRPSRPEKEPPKYLFVNDDLPPRERRAHVMRNHNQKRGLQRTGPRPLIRNNRTSPPARAQTSPLTDSMRSPSPATVLNSFKKDPFDSLPAVNSLADQELVDAWVSKLSYWSGQNQYIKLQVFNTAKAHPVCFQAVILAYSARWRASLYGYKSSPEAAQHLVRASSMLGETRGQRNDDILAMALAGMSLHENRFGDSELAAMKYEDQAVGILRHRQGPRGIAEVFLHYVRYLKMPPREASLSSNKKRLLIDFLRAAEDLKLEHSADTYLSSVPQRRTAFQMSGPLYRSLCPGPWPTAVPQNLHKYVLSPRLPTHEVSRTACLIYITIALREFRDAHSKTIQFLAHLHELVTEYKLDRNPAFETFTWLLLEDRYSADLRDEQDRAWQTGELLKMAKQLPLNMQVHFSKILFSYLMLETPAVDVRSFERDLYAAVS
ncbi:uncharacterized protein BO97DRAFT_442851 [Aspergillus homomorphus CBS 101889]|uniref:Uncharacterized protein n=1 Tax=Aspergillus homomorphus (strain CBS 101889) TaxID=1450537 RepID=A0A395HZN5_ASPHC|nr:hypothetical protein BO97DRAFT_442851 [Aspergillus homomorphus CBS 101889]RAL13016.1 hypothetical protein BO97DRAFT_442851 [Aspergillus homomorphus CBS 101889]